MLAWVVIDRQHLRQAAPFASLHSSPLFPLPHLSPLLPVAYALPLATAPPQPLCDQSVTYSFYLDGGWIPPVALPSRQRSSRIPIPCSLSPFFSISCALFRTFLHSPKTQLFYFQAIPHSASKNTTTGRGKGYISVLQFFRNTVRSKWATLSAHGTPVTSHQSRVTSHQSLPLAALPFARGYRSARIRME